MGCVDIRPQSVSKVIFKNGLSDLILSGGTIRKPWEISSSVNLRLKISVIGYFRLPDLLQKEIETGSEFGLLK